MGWYHREGCFFFFFQAEDGIRDAQESRGLGDVYKRQTSDFSLTFPDDAFIEGWLRKYFGALQRDIDSIAVVSSSLSSGRNGGENGGAVKKDEILTWLSLPSTKAIPTTDEEYAKAVQLTKFFSLVSHFMWSVWSVIQATPVSYTHLTLPTKRIV
eukprot:TRINITY_DN9411_c0_g2_i2.p1 TRINITY_DN9411_c0_g2~~TRINITY_DN9411_c0_g2_i2.p1  ORF type:complete len:155 (+),score=46.75 TRINITY_DN9411_c0_g2_i2:26-490(+)